MTTTEAPRIDESRIEAFAGELVGVLNNASLALMLSIGHQTGLFDAMAGLRPATSDEIAAEAGLHERYVRECLGALVAGRVVEYDRATRTYRLPPEHAAAVTRAAGPNNLAAQMQFIPLLAQVEPDIVECFREGGGVPYTAYHRFHRLMAEDSAALHDASLLDGIVPLVPGLRERLQSGIDVLDVGCGAGHALVLLAQAFPNSRFAGYDIAEEALAAGRAEASAKGLTNVRFEKRDVATLDEPARYALVTAFDAIHDQAHPDRVLAACANALEPRGVFLMADFDASSDVADNSEHPLGPFIYTASTLHCMTVSLAQGGTGLGTAWGKQLALRMLAEAGFTNVEVKRQEADAFNNYYICTR
jgi:2-polyprenyl-3-methyl-5-hydroxy-6-metoxy-1,4-benzoquinol methylase